MEKPSWVCTVVTQLCLCIGLYVAFNLGQSQKLIRNSSSRNSLRSRDGFLDFHFVTVRGGSRPPNEQTRLLKLMEKVSKTFNARFIINISELGESDPLRKNGTENFTLMKVPWYTTKVSSGAKSYFQQQIKMPYGRNLDIIGVDTGFVKTKDSMVMGPLSGIGDEQYQWITKTIESSDSDWRIVVGLHPLSFCQANKDPVKETENSMGFQELFVKFGVNAYLSGMSCTGFACPGGLTYIGHPSLFPGNIEKNNSFSLCGRLKIFSRELVNGLLLHRVTSLEIVTYFISSTGEVVCRTVLQQLGKEVM